VTVKLLPCVNSPGCKARGFALWPASRLHPEGEPAFSGQYASRYECARCHKVTYLSIQEWHRLPSLEHTDHFEALARHFHSAEAKDAIRNLPTGDLVSYGLPRAHAKDLFNAGIQTVDDARALERGKDAKDSDSELTN
jgi:hypothetical protein